MSLFSSADLQGAIDAIDTKSTLEQVELRKSGSNAMAQAKTGPRNITASASSSKLPVYDENGQLFASSIIGEKNRGLALPSNVTKGSIISYKNEKGEIRYGIVGEPEEKDKVKGVYVKSLSEDEVNKLKEEKPDIEIFNFKVGDLSILKVNRSILSKVIDWLDPSETIVFKFLTKMLMGKFEEMESATDIFLMIYFRFLTVALIAITIGLITSRFI